MKVNDMLRKARLNAGLSLMQAALALGFSERHLRRLETGTQEIDASTVLRASDLYSAPEITTYYCRRSCAIGERYCYELLNAVDISPVAILAKYRDEMGEVNRLLDDLISAVLNRQNGDQLTAGQRALFERAFQELLDVEHVIEVLKLAASRYVDVPAAIRAHNQKCYDRGYVKPEMKEAS